MTFTVHACVGEKEERAPIRYLLSSTRTHSATYPYIHRYIHMSQEAPLSSHRPPFMWPYAVVLRKHLSAHFYSLLSSLCQPVTTTAAFLLLPHYGLMDDW